MDRMLIEPLPGAALPVLESIVREVGSGLVNVRGTAGSPRDRYSKYISWANLGVRKLANVGTAASLERLILTRRYWLLQSLSDQADTASLSELLDVELGEREKAFEIAQAELKEAIGRWSRPGRYVVPDTSFYVEHSQKLEDVDFRPLLSLREEPIRIVLPILVVDELDGLKRSGRKDARWRALYTLAVLERALPSPLSPGILHHEDRSPLEQHTGSPKGEVSIEVVLDPPGHSRLPINDDEIVSRALAVQAFVNQPVTMLTCDTHQAFRAKGAQLTVIKLPAESDQIEE